MEYPRNRRGWQRQEVAKAIDLLKKGYEKGEVALHMGRSPGSLVTALAGYGFTISDLQAACDKVASLSLPELPPYKVQAQERVQTLLDQHFAEVDAAPHAQVAAAENEGMSLGNDRVSGGIANE